MQTLHPLSARNGTRQKKRRPVAMTLGSDANGQILARMDPLAVELKACQLYDFVRIRDTVGRIVSIQDCHDYRSDTELALLARDYLITQSDPDPHALTNTYKKMSIEPLGTISGGLLCEYTGGIGYFHPVYRALPDDIAGIYPPSEGVCIGNVTSGIKETPVPFFLGRDTALSRHCAIFGKNGSGKTNLLKEVIAANQESKEPLPMLVFGHPDLGLSNPNDGGSKGLSSLYSENLVLLGYRTPIKVSPEELSLYDIFEHFENMSTSMKDLWAHMHSREPKTFIHTLAGYDVNDDPLELHRKTIKDRQNNTIEVKGVANLRTIDAVSKQARVLCRYVDAKAPPVLSQIIGHLKQKKTVLVNTFNLSDSQQGWLIKLVLERLQKAGKAAMHKGIGIRFLVIVDEAQHFVARTGEAIGEFCREARKFGLTILFATQSPLTIPESIKGQIYSVISFHINRPDLVELAKMAPSLYDLRNTIARPPLKNTVGVAIAHTSGYPYPAIVKVPLFERRFRKGGGMP